MKEKWPKILKALALNVAVTVAYAIIEYYETVEWLLPLHKIVATEVVLFVAAFGVFYFSGGSEKYESSMTVLPLTWIAGCVIQSIVVKLA